MNRLGFIILSILKEKQAADRLSAMTISEITSEEDLECRSNTVYKRLKEFEREGYVRSGMKDGRAMAYYLTDDGSLALRMERQAETKGGK